MFWVVFMCLSFYLVIGCRGAGGGRWSPRGLVHHLLLQFFTLGSSRMEVFETHFFETVITSTDRTRNVKHVLDRIYVFLILLSYWLRGAGVPRDWYTTCFCSFSPWAAQKWKFCKLIIFDTVII